MERLWSTEMKTAVLYQIDKCLLQISRVFLRSQPTPSPSQEGKSGVRSHLGIALIPFFRA
ncbi:MAG: hypothetical protein F6K48_21370 [Okeania sp. SIO3H1]|nr:hypothetical protein [Okeania sp. SIO3H1]